MKKLSMMTLAKQSPVLTVLLTGTALLAAVPFIQPGLTEAKPVVKARAVMASAEQPTETQPTQTHLTETLLTETASTQRQPAAANPSSETVQSRETQVKTGERQADETNKEAATVAVNQLPVWAGEVDYSYPALQDFAQIQDVRQKKQAFFDYLTPAVIELNQRIADQRAWLEVQAVQTVDTAENRAIWQALLAEYRMQEDTAFNPGNVVQLLNRADQIPLELVLIQAANESAWGTSRFATQGNNLFGQWCFKPGCGLVPANRPAGERYEVQLFSSVKASVHSYLRNLNTHFSYQELRLLRSGMRATNSPLDAKMLAEGLGSYSTRGADYIAELLSMMRHNQEFILAAERAAISAQASAQQGSAES